MSHIVSIHLRTLNPLCLCLSTVPGFLYQGLQTEQWLKEAVKEFIKTESYKENPFRINIDGDYDSNISYLHNGHNLIQFLN